MQKSSTASEIGGVWAVRTALSDTPNTEFLLLAPSTFKWTGWVSWWDLAQWTDQRQIHAHLSQEIGQLAVSPDGQILATTASDTYVKLWSVATGEPWKPSALRGNMLSMHGVAFAPDGARLATGGNGKEAVKLWDLITGQEVITLDGNGMLFHFTRFSPDGNVIAAINAYGQAHLWRAPSWAEIEAREEEDDSHEPER
jgi:WD40 repeat protein